MEVREDRRAWVVVAAVLRPVGEHRAVWADRASHEERAADRAVALAAVRAAALATVALTRVLGQLHAESDQGQTGRAVQAGRGEPLDGGLVAGGRRDPGARPEVGEMGLLDGGGVCQQETRGPQRIGKVVAARGQFGRQPAVEHDRTVQRPPDGVHVPQRLSGFGRSRRGIA